MQTRILKTTILMFLGPFLLSTCESGHTSSVIRLNYFEPEILPVDPKPPIYSAKYKPSNSQYDSEFLHHIIRPADEVINVYDTYKSFFSCSDERLYLCRYGEFPIFIPKNNSINRVDFPQLKKSYTFQILDKKFDSENEDACDLESFYILVQFKMHKEIASNLYHFDRKKGLVRFKYSDIASVKQGSLADKSFYELYDGNIFTHSDICN